MLNIMHELNVNAASELAVSSSHCAHFCRQIDTAAVGPKTKFVGIESPTNPRQQISNIWVIYYRSLCS